jgi:hypothetical protein
VGTPQGVGRRPSREEEPGFAMVADGVADVMAAVRMQLQQGVSRIKLAD